MSVLQLRYLGDPILKKKAQSVPEVDEEIRQLAHDMIETMYFNRGAGLAAPQVGVSRRVIVYDHEESGSGTEPQVLINPAIVDSEGTMRDEEGCLSVPELKDMVERKAKIAVTGLDLEGREVRIVAEGIHSRILQHEIDHLEGILFVDRVGLLKKKLLLSKWKKIRKKLEPERIV